MKARTAYVATIAIVAAVCFGGGRSAGVQVQRPIGDARVFAKVAYPGHPGGIVVDGNTVYVNTANAFTPPDRALDESDSIFIYDTRTGKLDPHAPNPILVPRRTTPGLMGLAGMALDAGGRLYIAEMTGRIVRVDPKSGKQDTYATIPTDSRTSYTSMPGFVVFDQDGNLYTGDTAGPPVIWRVPPGGGQAEPWFVDPRLASVYTQGLGGLKIDPTGKYMYFQLYQPAPGSAVVFRIPLDDPSPLKLQEFHRFAPGSIFPISMAFGASGKLYSVSIADGVHVLRPDGTEEIHFPSDAMMEPWSCPFDLAFDGRGSLLVTNLGCEGALPSQDPETWTVVDAWVNDTALPLYRPSIPG